MRRLAGVLVLAALAAACGKKGPPLPPLVRVPQAPAEFSAERRADTVNLQFVVPTANTDGSKPANIQRVDVYAMTGNPDVSDAMLLKHGTRVGTVAVKAPRDPDAAVDPEDEEDGAEEPDLEGAGLDQGAIGHVDERLTEASASRPTPKGKASERERRDLGLVDVQGRPLVDAPSRTLSRVYVSVGVNKRGKPGRLSRRVSVPLVPPPPAPPAPALTYDETHVLVAWTSSGDATPAASSGEQAWLPSRTFGATAPPLAYNVYDVTPPPGDADVKPAAGAGVKLTKSASADMSYSDARIEWGARRCYTVRAVETFGGLSLESAASPMACTTLVDTFAPAAPTGLQAVASPGEISLIWQPNTEKDVAGYLVFRGTPGGTLQAITAAPVQDATFKDSTTAGTRYVYRVRAVDKAGNASELSSPVEETAR